MAADELVELCPHARVPAASEVGVDQILDGRETELVESPDRRLREAGIVELRQRATAPECESGSQFAGGQLGVAGFEGVSSCGEMLFERPQIELPGLDRDHVAGWLGRYRPRSLCPGERLA